MRPRVTLLAVLLILVVAYVLRGYLLWARVIPTDDQDLHQASRLRVHYYNSSKGMIFLEVNDPDQVRDTLGALTVRSTNRRRYYGYSYGPGTVQVEFHFANGAAPVYAQFRSASQLTRHGWGEMTIDPAFYAKIRALIRQADPQWSDPHNVRMDSK